MNTSLNQEPVLNRENTEKKPRIEVIDALRGFAILGIGITHILNSFYTNNLPPGYEYLYNKGLNHILLELDLKLIVGKFFTLFCFLFGLSFSIQKTGFITKSGSFQAWFLKRMVILLLIGFCHYVFWRGDILITYGVFGIFLLVLDPLPKSWKIILMVLLTLAIPTVLIHQLELYRNWIQGVRQGELSKTKLFFDLIQKGSLWETIKYNFLFLSDKFEYLLNSGRLFSTLGLFLLGSLVGYYGLFNDFEKKREQFLGLFKWTSLIWISIVLLNFLSQRFFKKNLSNQAGQDLYFIENEINNLAQCAWYVFGFCSLYYLPRIQKVLSFFIPIGKMALSNYLFQTLVCVFIFYSFGLGLFLKTSVFQNLILAILIFGLEYYLSNLWLKNHKYGPIEGFWRLCTDWKGWK